jgi:hypothetical protein
VNVLVLIAAGVFLRQCFVLMAIVRSARFLRAGLTPVQDAASQVEHGPTFFVLVPMLRETAIVADAVSHFQAMTEGHAAQLVVVTTEREAAHEPAVEGAITTGATSGARSLEAWRLAASFSICITPTRKGSRPIRSTSQPTTAPRSSAT